MSSFGKTKKVSQTKVVVNCGRTSISFQKKKRNIQSFNCNFVMCLRTFVSFYNRKIDYSKS